MTFGSAVFRHAKGNATDVDALRAAKIEAGIEEDSEDEQYEEELLQYLENEKKKGRDMRGEIATDDVSSALCRFMRSCG
jgi:hypothetical protein